MAQKVSITLVSDISGTEIVDGAGQTVKFGLDGVSYEIDLTDEEAAKMRETLSAYMNAGRRAKASRQKRSSSANGGGAGSGPSAADIRLWAKENGYDVPDRGRIPSDVRAAHTAAH